MEHQLQATVAKSLALNHHLQGMDGKSLASWKSRAMKGKSPALSHYLDGLMLEIAVENLGAWMQHLHRLSVWNAVKTSLYLT